MFRPAFQVDDHLTLQTVLDAPAQRRRLAHQLACHGGWRTTLDLEEGAVTAWLDQQLEALGTAAVVEALAAIPHHPGVLWGLWIPMAQLMGRLQQTNPLPRIGLVGVPGTGKTTLGLAMAVLGRAYGFSPIVASIDDYYLPLPIRAAAMAANPFAVDRGPPGSHDLIWLNRSLDDFAAGGRCSIPRFDKGLAGGLGDRNGQAEHRGDVFLLEGWMVGGRPFLVGPDDPHPGASAAERAWCARCSRVLADYTATWTRLHGLVLVLPRQWRHSLRWRLQAEARQRRRGKGALSGVQLERLLRCFWASVPPHRALQPPQPPGDGAPPVLMVVSLDGRRRLVDVGPPGTVSWPAPAQLSSSSSPSSSMG